MTLGCLGEDPATEDLDNDILNTGYSKQGTRMDAFVLDGVQGFKFGGATLNGSNLTNVHVEKGELVASRGGTTLRGTGLQNAHLFAQVVNGSIVRDVEYQITKITAEEDSAYDPTHTGNTYLYTLQQFDANTNTWVHACRADDQGYRYAIPVAGIFNAHGDRLGSSTMFTFGCTSGVIAKCYRWGYRPWLTGYGVDMVATHWTCTRMARADYCGDGTSHTKEGTPIGPWDILPSPGPIDSRDTSLLNLGLELEAGWNTGGAVCASTTRWVKPLETGELLTTLAAAKCPKRLIRPGLANATVCNLPPDLLKYDASAKVLNDKKLCVDLLGLPCL